MSEDTKPKPLLLSRLRLVFAALAGVAIGSVVAGVLLAAIEIPTQITEAAHPEFESTFVPATPGQMVTNVIGLAIMSAIVGLMFGGPVFLLIGLPLHGMLMRLGWTGIFAYAAAGAAVSGLLVTLTQAGMNGALMLLNPSKWPTLFSMAPYFALAGAIATSVFWLIRRPDRDALTSPATS